MAKYAKYQRKSEPKKQTNPIWRGIGCILIVVVPLISYGLTALFLPTIVASGLAPQELMGHVKFPEWSLRTPILADITGFISGFNDLWLKLIIFFVILLLLTAVSGLLYTMVAQVVGPPRYSEKDAPPSTHKAKEYKR